MKSEWRLAVQPETESCPVSVLRAVRSRIRWCFPRLNGTMMHLDIVMTPEIILMDARRPHSKFEQSNVLGQPGQVGKWLKHNTNVTDLMIRLTSRMFMFEGVDPRNVKEG